MSSAPKPPKKISEALTWDELADAFDKRANGLRARARPMDEVFDWAANQPDKYYTSPDGTIHLILKP
jgi:hypothetical protein